MTRFAWSALIAAAVAAPLSAEDKALKDLAGAYAVKEFERDGKPVPDKVRDGVTAVKIADGKLSITAGGKELVATLKMDAAKKPADLDLFPQGADYDKGRRFPGIVKAERETVTILYVEDGDRPKDFAGGLGSTKLVLVRK